MSNPINPITPLKPISLQENKKIGLETVGFDQEQNFSALLKQALNKLDESQAEAAQATVDLVTGQAEDFHTPVIVMEKASLTLGLAVTVRNKVLEAYHEIMRMQI